MTAPAPTATRARLLVVDDDERSRRLLRGWLAPEHDLVEAADGPSALDLLEEQPPDLVLLDVMMPGMSGFDVCRELKRRQADRAILPVILLTALSDQQDRTEGLRAGADEFVSKPCDRTELRLRVETLLRTRRQELLIRRQLAALSQLAALKDDLVSLVVHDLRGPLSGALSLLHGVRREVSDPELGADLDAVIAATSRATATAEELLEVRLLEEGRIVPSRVETDVGELVTRAVGAFEAAARTRGISFALTIPERASFELDGALVRRALENLLANAVRYAPEGSEITVAARRAGAALTLEVSDRGPGIPPGLRGSLFEKFGGVRARCGAARRGFGLGLFLVRLVAEVHGGDATVGEPPGGGTSFRVRLAPAPAAGAATVSHEELHA